MKKLTIVLLLLCLLLSSCRPVEKNIDSYDVNEESLFEENETTASDSEPSESVTDTDAPETESPLPCLIGLYDDLNNDDNYTRLTTWNEPWISGKDIAVFDVIPSTESKLYSPSYKELWKAQSSKISPDALVKPYFELIYTLADDSEKSVMIYSYSDAEAVIDDGYIEIYLYDDVHQPDGAWYSHLVESTTNDDTVISSIKITAGKLIDDVKSIKLFAYIDGSSGASVDIINGK